jgi:hypothetical protein
MPSWALVNDETVEAFFASILLVMGFGEFGALADFAVRDFLEGNLLWFFHVLFTEEKYEFFNPYRLFEFSAADPQFRVFS